MQAVVEGMAVNHQRVHVEFLARILQPPERLLLVAEPQAGERAKYTARTGGCAMAREHGLDGLFYHTTHEDARQLVVVLYSPLVFLMIILTFPLIEPGFCQFGAQDIKRHDDCQDGHKLERQKSKLKDTGQRRQRQHQS